ncbi:Hypothetical protein SMAX5B_005079 [Scophthalmus maximus]|uniref:Uncharacterized protein n=1 Tax=Scophthalmus maximus TaxID=52904 RepID=A0A2U9BVB2_SCOMX|nr:Hypothetical protein SMAX5B_005079 [Scophthalmus maximus]
MTTVVLTEKCQSHMTNDYLRNRVLQSKWRHESRPTVHRVAVLGRVDKLRFPRAF